MPEFTPTPEAREALIEELRKGMLVWDPLALSWYAPRGLDALVDSLFSIGLVPGDEFARHVAARGVDERIRAWNEIARHPFFASCFDGRDVPLPAMIRKLDRTVAALSVEVHAETPKPEDMADWPYAPHTPAEATNRDGS